jgi:prepilin-type N-terminal cleavage/methylation domain-containing protein
MPVLRSPTAHRGFTFVEILVVMALMGVLMGIGVGYLTNVKSASRGVQARAVLRETAFACKQSSNGGTRAIFDLRMRDRDNSLIVGAAIAKPVLTHNFESIDFVSQDYPLSVEGNVEVKPNGYTGNAGVFERGGFLHFERQSAFAMSEGIVVSMWVRPEAEGGPRMTLLKGDGAYEVRLAQERGLEGRYNVVLRLQLKTDTGERSVARSVEFSTKGSPVKADGRTWSHLQVSYDGTAASIRVNGLEVYKKRKIKSAAPVTPGEVEVAPMFNHIAVPEGGAVELFLSDMSHPFLGAMDEVVLGGVFRSSDTDRIIGDMNGGFELLRPRLPVRVFWRNGRLDPDEHSGDVVLLFKEQGGKRGAPLLEFRIGLYGTIEDRLVVAASGDAP